MSKTLYLVDISSYVFRAYYAIRPLQTSRGIPTNATYGVITMLLKLIREKKPDSMVIVFDAPVPSFRKEIYKEYKANREAPPEDLPVQFDHIREFVETYPLPFLIAPGYEADDLIATIVRQFKFSPSPRPFDKLRAGSSPLKGEGEEKRIPPPLRGGGIITPSPLAGEGRGEGGFEIIIVSADKDLMQLIGPGVKMYDSMREKEFTPVEVKEKFGVDPEHVVDVMALSGDASDNIPGVKGIGGKTAAKLIAEWGDLDKLLAHATEIKGKVGEMIREQKERALLSRKLVTLHDEVPLPKNWGISELSQPHTEALNELYKKFELRSLISGGAPPSPLPPPLKGGGIIVSSPLVGDSVVSLSNQGQGEGGKYDLILTEADLKKWADRLKKTKEGFAFDTETTGVNPFTAHLVGISLSDAEGEGCYIPVAHSYLGCPTQIAKSEVIKTLKPLFADISIPKYSQNGKYDIIILSREGVVIGGFAGDSMIASYLINPEGAHSMDHLANEYLGYKTLTFSEVVKKGETFDQVELNLACRYAAEDADITRRLNVLLEKKLDGEGLSRVYKEMEIPLVSVLFRMEAHGVFIDRYFLGKLSQEFGGRLKKLEEEIFELTGTEFNVASPKQVAGILFGKLNLPVQRKTKTGYSTDEEVLTKLARLHPMPKSLLAHRMLSKLKNTYVDGLVGLLNPADGRIHTSYNQTVAATGRLSSSEPNLQNIPVRSEEGRRIREAFRAPKGCKIISADYSQIELRLLAAFSGDPHLIRAFEEDEDIHRMTAEKIFNLSEEKITDEQRSRAKTVNFGILYGQSPFGLSQMLEIPQSEAKLYIEQFYRQYPAVQKYRELALEGARNNGVVTTWMGRRRFVPEIKSGNAPLRANAERMAFNTIFQGSAADLIKVAMIRIDEKLSKFPSPLVGEGARRAGEGGVPKMIMQVHDELVFEVPEKEVGEISAMVKTEMENAISCSVPLKVDISVGEHWE